MQGLCYNNYIRRDYGVVKVRGAEITVEDAAGHLWCIGDTVALHKHTNFTPGTIVRNVTRF